MELEAMRRKMKELEAKQELDKTITKEDKEAHSALIEDKKKIEELEKKLKKQKKKSEKGSPSKSPSKKTQNVDQDEEMIDTTTIAKQTIVKRGLDAEEVMELIKTVMESTQKGVPLETQTLGKTGALTKTLPQEFISDLEKLQKDKINFIGSKGGVSVMQATNLTRRDKIYLMKLGLAKGLMDDDLGGKSYPTQHYRNDCQRAQPRKRAI